MLFVLLMSVAFSNGVRDLWRVVASPRFQSVP
jgi:hypothetical protein